MPGLRCNRPKGAFEVSGNSERVFLVFFLVFQIVFLFERSHGVKTTGRSTFDSSYHNIMSLMYSRALDFP